MILSGGGEKIILNVNIFLEFLYKNIFVVDTFRVRYFVRTFGFFGNIHLPQHTIFVAIL